MCKNKKKCRQFLECAVVVLGLIAVIMCFLKIRQKLDCNDCDDCDSEE